MPSKTKKSNQFTINTTSLTVQRSKIDYEVLRQHLRIYVYDLSESRIYPDANCYRRMYSSLRKQTIMADGSQYAFEFNKSRKRVYICLPVDKYSFEIEDFEGERYQPLEFSPELDDNGDIADLFRLACKVYCVRDEIDMSFVGQGPMYFPTGRVYNYKVEEEEPGPRKPEGRPVLGVYPRHNWKRDRQLAEVNGGKQDTLEFLMPDMLRQMYLVYKTDTLTKESLVWRSYYKLASGGKAFVPLIPRDIDNLSKCAVYRLQGENRSSGKKSESDNSPSQANEMEKGSLPPNKKKWIEFFNPTKPEKLKQSRCHVLLSTYRKLSQYLTKIGLPTELTRIQVKEVTLQKKASFPLSKYPVTLINGLWQEGGGAGSQRRQERFEKMVATIQKILDKEISVVVKGRESLENPLPDERFLILIDYSQKAFEEGGPLAGLPDPYQDDLLYKKQGVVLKHLNINSEDNLASEDDSERDPDGQIPGENSDSDDSDLEGTPLQMSKSKYLSYKLPTDKPLENRLWVSLYNLHILDLLCHPQRIWQRMPLFSVGKFFQNMSSLLEGVFFIHKRNVLYFKENSLCFQKVSDRVFKEDLKQLTGRDYKDILLQMEHYHTWNVQKLDVEQEKELRKNSDVMVSKEYLIEISQGNNCRALFDTEVVLNRIEQRQKGRPLDEFKVSSFDQIPSAWRDTFNNWNKFVDDLSRKKDVEDLVSFEKLTKDSAKGGYNGYQVIPRKNTTKVSEFNDILSNAIRIDLRTPINGMDYGKGIWFDKESMKYMVGGGLAINGKKAMVRSNLVRDIILLEGQFNPDQFFPLLNVDFVRKEGYPVLPFPFKILKDAMELEEIGWKFGQSRG